MTKKSLYLGNDTRQAHKYNGRLSAYGLSIDTNCDVLE